MKEGLDRPNRREFLKQAVAAATLSTLRIPSTEAQEGEHKFFASSLTPEKLAEHKETAAHALVENFWDQKKAREHITSKLLDGAKTKEEAQERLKAESRMFVPELNALMRMRTKNSEQLEELAQNIPEGKYGLFLDGDAQTLHLIQNAGGRKMQFVKAYPVSTSKSEWSNEPDTRGTPLGLHTIAAEYKGLFGQLVSSPLRGVRDFTQITVREGGKNRKRTFVNSIRSDGDEEAELITASLLITGPSTPSTRGIYLHGTNRVDKLGGYDSGGCVRLSSVDVYDLLKYVGAGKLQKDERSAPGGTPVMIAATIPENEADRRGIYPPRLKYPIEPKTPEAPARIPAESTPDVKTPRKSKRPPRLFPVKE